MRVLFASSELFPLAKTGGLADVSAALPAALAALGTDVRLVIPGYTQVLDGARGKHKAIALGDILGLGDTFLIPAQTPDNGLPLWVVDCPPLFQRRGGLYVDADGRDWSDNAQRFALLSHVTASLALGAAGNSWVPQLVHVNDWHLGLVPALLAGASAPRPPTVLTIHNLAFQGAFPAAVYPYLGLPSEWFTSDGIEFFGQVSFLKAGIRFADRLTTVSPTYAREILTPEFGCGLDGMLRARAHDLVGIVNGIDDCSWTPEDPTTIPFPYNVKDLSGKRHCKAMLQKEMGLSVDPEAPTIAFISRLTEQKMADVLPEIVPTIINQGGQLLVCGKGHEAIEQRLHELQVRYPHRVAVQIGYCEALARRILAGVDILAAPSRYEPCGLIQMYAMRYGTLPIVRRVGGLADTVTSYDERELASGPQATGFTFEEPTAEGLAQAIELACRVYKEPLTWRTMQTWAMSQDFSWKESATRYLSLYRSIAHDRYDELLTTQPAPIPPELRLTGS